MLFFGVSLSQIPPRPADKQGRGGRDFRTAFRIPIELHKFPPFLLSVDEFKGQPKYQSWLVSAQTREKAKFREQEKQAREALCLLKTRAH